jgi:hypothetical protein
VRIEHVFKLLLGPAVETNKFQTESVVVFPANHRYRDHNRRPSACGLYAESEAAINGKSRLTLYFCA